MDYKGSNIKVCIICPKHGEFWQTPASHLNGNGCKKCFNEYVGEKCRKNNDIFLKELNNLYGNKYDYSKVVFNGDKNVIIINNENGDTFYVNPYKFLNGYDYSQFIKQKEKLKEDFIKKAKAIHRE